MEKGNSKQEMLERFKDMGVPTPMEPIKNVPRKGNPEKMSKLDEIRNGSLKTQYTQIIEKTEKITPPTSLPVPKVGQKPGSKGANKMTSFAQKSSSSNATAMKMEAMMYGDSTSSAPAGDLSSIDDYGPAHVDTKTILKERLANRNNQAQETYEGGFNPTHGLNLTEAELNEKITEISTKISKSISEKMVKAVILEYAKRGKGIIIESKTIKKAEIVDRNKVKIGGRIYKLTPVK